jgi:hypothetical protein
MSAELARRRLIAAELGKLNQLLKEKA